MVDLSKNYEKNYSFVQKQLHLDFSFVQKELLRTPKDLGQFYKNSKDSNPNNLINYTF